MEDGPLASPADGGWTASLMEDGPLASQADGGWIASLMEDGLLIKKECCLFLKSAKSGRKTY